MNRNRSWVLALTLWLGLSTLTLAAPRGELRLGRVISVDTAASSFVLEQPAGGRPTIFWTPETAFLTRPTPGLEMKVYVETDSAGRLVALRAGKAEKPGPTRRR